MSELADRMQADALEAQKFTRKHLVAELDFSAGSVRELEAQFDVVEFAIRGGKSPANIDLLTRIWGAYLGEVIRRHRGGQWCCEPADGGPRVALRRQDETIYPHEQVRLRLTAGPQHNVCEYFAQRREQR